MKCNVLYVCMYVCMYPYLWNSSSPRPWWRAQQLRQVSQLRNIMVRCPSGCNLPVLVCWLYIYIHIYIYIYICIYVYIYIWWGYLPHNWSAVPVSGNIHNHIIPSYIAGYPQLGEKTTNPKPFVRWGWSLSVRQGMIKKQWFEARNQGFTI